MNPPARLRVIAGSNGSGKTTLANNLKSLVQFGAYLNPDEFEKSLHKTGKLFLSKFPAEITTDGLEQHFSQCPQLRKYSRYVSFINSVKINKRSVVILKEHINSYVAASISDFLRDQFIQHRISFTFETVMSHPSKLDIIHRANQQGYRPYLYFVSTDRVEINVERVKNRVKEGGHSVPENKIKSRFVRTMNLLRSAVLLTNRAFLFDNSGEEQKWFAEITDGTEIEYRTKSIPTWFRDFILYT